MLKVRNPSATQSYRGPYSDNSNLWTDQLKQDVDFANKGANVFFIDIDSYFQAFSETWVSYDTSNWSSARFLYRNDQSQAEHPGVWEGICGSSCSRHIMTLKSDIDQTVHLTAFTWDARGIPDQCISENDSQLYHSMYIESKYPADLFVWHYGERYVEPFDMTAGEEIMVELEWNFGSQAHANDWSLIAFGEGPSGNLHMTHSRGKTTDAFPYIPRQAPEPFNYQLPQPGDNTSGPADEDKVGGSGSCAPCPPCNCPSCPVCPACPVCPEKEVAPTEQTSEEAFTSWVNGVTIPGSDCSYFREEVVKNPSDPNDFFFRAAIKS